MSKKKVPNLSQIFGQEIDRDTNDNSNESLHVKVQAKAKKETIVENSRDNDNYIYKEDKKNRMSTTIYLPMEVKRQLEELWFAVRHEKSQNDLILDSLDLLFKSKGLKTFKELVDNS